METTIDLDAVANHEFIIKPDFDPDLQGIIFACEKRKTIFYMLLLKKHYLYINIYFSMGKNRNSRKDYKY